MMGKNIKSQANPGPVFWITGLSGSGKTTIARQLHATLLQQTGIQAVLLDGDHLREVFGEVFGHEREERLNASLCYGRLCKLLSEQGVTVICSTISLFHQTQAWNRAHIPCYLEIYIKVPLNVLMARDSKGIYARTRQGELRNVVGIDIPAEEPGSPDLIIENHGDMTVTRAVQRVEELYRQRFGRA